MRKKQIVHPAVFCMIAFLISACSSVFYTPTADMKIQGASVEDLSKGKSIYMNKCGSCHRLHTPYEYNAEQWKHHIDDMQERAQVTDPEKKIIHQYLINAPKKK